MAQVMNGRFTAEMDEPFAVFIIGMRINNFLAFRKWIPTIRAMGPMLKELYRRPEKGFLGADFFFHLRGPMLVQYWRSFDDLERFARNPDDPHLPAWRRFNQKVGSDGSVGIWHETYIVERGNFEAIYSNMPLLSISNVILGDGFFRGRGHLAPRKAACLAGRKARAPRESPISAKPSLEILRSGEGDRTSSGGRSAGDRAKKTHARRERTRRYFTGIAMTLD